MITNILSIFFSIIFFISFSSKITGITNFSIDIYSYGLVNYRLSRIVAPAVLLIEILLAIFFLHHSLVIWAVISSILLMLLFTAALIIKRFSSSKKTCSCFGKIKFLNEFPLTRNIILILLLGSLLYLTM